MAKCEYIIGVDIGGTNIKIGYFDYESMKLIGTNEFITPKDNQESSIFACLVECIKSYFHDNNLDYNKIKGIGLAVPAPVVNGYVNKAANLSWHAFNCVEELRKHLSNKGIVIAAINDANAAAYGENRLLEKPYDNVVFYTLGTGIGGGIIINKKLIEGLHGSAGELGHMFFSDEIDEVCGCGQKGCLEQLCGTQAILNYTKGLINSNKYKTSLNPDNLTIKAIFSTSESDEISSIVLDKYAQYIGLSAVNLSCAVDPEAFIIGGGVSLAGTKLLDRIKYYYKKYARFDMGDTPFILAKTKNMAGFTGVAYYLKDMFFKAL